MSEKSCNENWKCGSPVASVGVEIGKGAGECDKSGATQRASKIQGEPVSRAMKPDMVNIPEPIMLAITTAAAVRHPIVRAEAAV